MQQKSMLCEACDLFKDATQTVFGSGPVDAKIVILGEQPGDQEDLHGKPFVGPAGQVLNEALAAAGIDRESAYLTNIVKHFKHVPVDGSSSTGGRRRLHKKPSSREVRCCRPWFDAEWSLLTEAKILVCLGATASNAVIGPGFRVSKQRGNIIESDYSDNTIATWHPSAILRTVDVAAKQQKMEQLICDLKVANDVSKR
ncbi:UdgX family uracil-DNA binding protein [bacterium]|nr:UdgX family uracil-DNA binding protein [bacterium]